LFAKQGRGIAQGVFASVRESSIHQQIDGVHPPMYVDAIRTVGDFVADGIGWPIPFRSTISTRSRSPVGR
jgi:hypothetical protein